MARALNGIEDKAEPGLPDHGEAIALGPAEVPTNGGDAIQGRSRASSDIDAPSHPELIRNFCPGTKRQELHYMGELTPGRRRGSRSYS